MSRGSFGRTVARAAASGGSKSYRARPPVLWYISLVLIVVAGIGLIVYSRNEAVHKASASTTSGPTKTDNWYTALAFDVCGKVQPNLATNTNLSTAGIRTFGDGVVNTNPGSVTDSAKFTGAHATLGTFVSTYGKGLQLTPQALVLPTGKGTAAKPATVRYTSGSRCTTGPYAGKRAVLQAKVWQSTTSQGRLYTGDPTAIKLQNGGMITVAFVPAGSSIPAPPASSTLLQDLGKK